MPSRRRSRLASESGQGIIEYTLVLALASLGMVLALLILQDGMGGTMLGSSHRIDAAGAGGAPVELVPPSPPTRARGPRGRPGRPRKDTTAEPTAPGRAGRGGRGLAAISGRRRCGASFRRWWS